MAASFPDPVTALSLGVICGFVTAVPGGPVNATILHEAGRRGLRWALFIGLGAIVMESGYCTLAFAGFANLFEIKTVRAVMELASFLLMLWLGIKYLYGSPIPGEV